MTCGMTTACVALAAEDCVDHIVFQGFLIYAHHIHWPSWRRQGNTGSVYLRAVWHTANLYRRYVARAVGAGTELGQQAKAIMESVA